MALILRYSDGLHLEDDVAGLLSEQGWRVGYMALERLAVEGDERARRLRLWVDVVLSGDVPGQQVQLRLNVCSDAWAPESRLPPIHVREAFEPEVAANPSAPLGYRISGVTRVEAALTTGAFWLKCLLQDVDAGTSGPPDAPEGHWRDDLPASLARWLAQTLRVDTVGGAVSCAMSGPVGRFGAVSRRVLERTGQADLEVDVTVLGEADDTSETGGDGTRFLALYGERHGAWLLHRRVAEPRRLRRADSGSQAPFQSDVLVADSAESLMRLAGLGSVEKRLFREAGILNNATLLEDDAEARVPHWIDVGSLPDRTRAGLSTIVSLANRGKLGAADIDLIARIARYLSGRNG